MSAAMVVRTSGKNLFPSLVMSRGDTRAGAENLDVAGGESSK